MPRGTALAITVVAGLTLACLSGQSAQAAAGDCTQFFDVNHDGHEDLAVGTPSEDVGYNDADGHRNLTDAGTVTVIYGDAGGQFGASDGRSYSSEDVGMTPAAKDRFGAAVLVADLNGDHCGDLVIGAPGKNHGAGAVVVLYGSPRASGVKWGTLRQVLRQGADGAPGKAEAGDHFGAALAVVRAGTSDFATQLWIGSPGEGVGSAKGAGSATVYPTQDGADLPTSGITMRTQNSAGYGTTAQAGDNFGATLAGLDDTVLIGVPGENLGKATDAGMFHSVDGTGKPRNWRQNGIPGAGGSEKGDRFGSSLALFTGCGGDLTWAAGAPGERIGSAKNAGLVVLYDQVSGKKLRVRQGVAGVPGGPETGDRFGAALVGAGNRVAIGAPGEDISGVPDAGTVVTLGTTCGGGKLATASVQSWYQGHGGLGGTKARNDRFGAGLGSTAVQVSGAAKTRLLISIPNEDENNEDGELVNSGMVLSLPATGTGFTATGSYQFGQDTEVDGKVIPGLGETDDRFGSALSATSPT